MKRYYRHKLSLVFKTLHFKQEGAIMPVPKKERLTSDTDSQTGEQVSPHVPDQQTFHEHLRTLTRHAVRVVIEEVMLPGTL
jgi:hypothetical protein